MNRRKFVTTAGMAGIMPAALSRDATPAVAAQQFYELREYTPRTGTQRGRLTAFLKDAAIPAWNRHGINSVGAFSVVHGPNAPTLYVLLAHETLASVSTLRNNLAGDEKFQADASDFLQTPLSDPGYTRIDSSLFKAFSAMPALAVPDAAAGNDPRIFELRIYESHSERAAIRKVEMFNNGEIPIFLDTGLTPVFFGEAIVGARLPNLTYLLTFKDLADREESWNRFRVHPDWKTMSSDPYYKDTVSNITSIILRPEPYSQL